MSKKREYQSNHNIILGGWDEMAYQAHVDPVAPKEYSPEEKLMLAVVVQAVEDATSPKVTPVIRDQARTAIFTSSATNIKDFVLFLGYDYDYFKETVARMIKEGRTINRAALFGGG
jgi:hypothetical protein